MILVVNHDLNSYEKVEETSFEKLNIWERKHIQEWIRQTPEILGEDLLVVSIEFDRFNNSNDRLDVLAIDREGNIVVIELKRDAFAGYADLQAIRYAAMVSSMTIEKLLPYYNHYQKKSLGVNIPTNENSLANITEFVNDEDFQELSNTPRIILCSEDFSQELTTTVLWLIENGLDITCVKIKPHQIGDKVAIVPNRIIPIQEAQQYLIDIQQKNEERIERKKRTRKKTMKILIEGKVLKEGDIIYLKNSLPDYLQYNEEDPTYKATITGKLGRSNAIKWEKDQQEYSISNLTWHIFKNHHPDKKNPGGINGNVCWVDEEGENLWTLAEHYLAKDNENENML
ncbi:MAG: hypothetical protein DHS20C13_30800 [Thermodesulfobacteriota bacterium]|nr:MAG: hypothetical protein DHS20C13_30800 [Thermodesulfobacteriota bacterium]